MTTTKPEVKVRMVLDPNAKPMTPDVLCRTLLGVSEANLIRTLQIFGNEYLDKEIERMKGGKAHA